MTSELAFRPHLPRHARHFARESVELIDHDVDGIFELQDFAADVHRDLTGQVAVGDSRGYFGDVADLGSQITGHEIHRVGKILPDTANALHLSLSAELTVGANFSRDARDFAGERVELVHHGVDGVLQLQNLTADVDRNLAGKVALRYCRGYLSDIADLAGQVTRHGVD